MNEEERVKKFKRDVCSVVGHDMSGGDVRCDRCEALNLEGAIRNHCDRYIGMKNSSSTYEVIRNGVEALLTKCRAEEEITDFQNVTAQQMPSGEVKVSAEVKVPWHFGTLYHVDIIL